MIYIRVDMNRQIATGHMMRCLAIADAIRTLGEDATFIVADKQGIELLEQRGYHAIVLHTAWDNMEMELSALTDVICENEITKILIDSYQVTKRYLEELSKLVKTVYIDDLNKFKYPVDAIICYANYWKKFSYILKNSKPKYYLGTMYTPLRQVFWECENKFISPEVKKVLILTGGSDPYNVTGKILESIDLSAYEAVDVICGMYNTNYDKLIGMYRGKSNVMFYRAVNDIEKYMQKADVAISAGGTSLYELCAVGTPTISYAFADNQLDNVRQFASDELIDYAGDVRKECITEKIGQYLEEYRCNFKLRKKKSKEMQKLVDGQGAIRLAKVLLEL